VLDNTIGVHNFKVIVWSICCQFMVECHNCTSFFLWYWQFVFRWFHNPKTKSIVRWNHFQRSLCFGNRMV